MNAILTGALIIVVAGILLTLVLIGAVINEELHHKYNISKYDYPDEDADWRLP